MTPSWVSIIKNQFVPAGRRPRTILSGPFKGLRLLLDLRFEARVFLGLYERGVAQRLPGLCRDIRTAIDIGTSEGLYACYLLSKTKAENVFSFEPDPACRELFAKNLQLNGLTGTSRLHGSEKFVGAVESATTQTVDGLGPVAFPCFVKMDIEGAEGDALRGARKLLEAGDVRWLIETHALALEEECIQTLQAAGFQTLVIKNNAWNNILPEQRPLPHNRWLLAARKPLTLR